MIILHKFSNKKIEKNVEENPRLLLTNKSGGFFNWQNTPESRYGGFFHKTKNTLFKSLESIDLKEKSEIKKIQNNFWNFEIERENGVKESFFTPYGFDALLYETNRDVTVELILDAKAMFDNDEWGRNYEISEMGGKIIIEYYKIKDGIKKYNFFMVITGNNLKYKIKKDWKLRDYKYDLMRKDPPFGRYVFYALEIYGSGFIFTVSQKKEAALKESERLVNSIDEIKDHHKKNIDYFYSNYNVGISDPEIDIAYIASKFALSNMLVYDKEGKLEGMYAGLPWFSQFWARDALISLTSLPKKLKRELFLLYLNEFNKNNDISPCNVGCIESSGSHGLFFKRAEDLISENLLSQEEIFSVKEILVRDIEKLLKEKTKDGFAVNGPKETWMDTDYASDARGGIRIEIQALRLRMYNLAAKLTGERKYFELEHELSKKVREYFWNEETLKDGIDDKEIRPNIFLAFYVYPELLFKHEWSKAFSSVLEDLFLNWGGLSSISKNSPLFCGKYRGCLDVDQSYHHGDSWYFLNNISTVALRKVDRRKFEKNVDAILHASTYDILWQGILGQHAELSSAEQFSSLGCRAQSWSSAMYVEAIDDILKKA
jgi:hypothetical protein